jgi:hypothetical protein
MQEIHSSETSVHTKSTQRYIPEDGILHNRREDLKSYRIRFVDGLNDEPRQLIL